ncbi:MAG: superinfection immunity protein [Rhodopseudomonas palustris]|uniref:Superinfection immunity protein n=1 Tax=Rhodopseudomonas palustris TaxID=1076 RepID=A0A933W321_RHOPL|nr:superinfection immunity protein [Rhodopseudomonas palustris]
MTSLAELPYDANLPAIVWTLYLVAAVLYCVPMTIGFIRNVEYKWPLYFGNLLLGWTGIGWAYAMYYAIFADREHAQARPLALAA